MSIGIYMPAYNVGKYIEKSIMSIKKQTYKDWELVIMDDFSDDDTHRKASSYSTGNIRVFKRDEHSGHIGKIKNDCIRYLDAHEYICHVGSDDMIPPYCLQTFVDFMDKNPDVGACCGNFVCFDDEGNKWSFPHVANSGDYNSSVLLRYMCLFPHRFYRRDVVASVGGYDEKLMSAVDYDLALKLDEVTKIHRIKDPITYYYRQHEQQVSQRARPEQDSNAKKALEAALKRRGIDGIIKNGAPPFDIEIKEEEHFIWGK